METLSRRKFLQMSALAAAGVAVVACAGTPEPTAAPKEEATPVPKAEATATPKPQEAPTATAAPAESAFIESPVLAELVQAGSLPAADERLPKNPALVRAGVLLAEDEVDFEIGKHGGTLRSTRNNPDWNPDVFVMNDEPLILCPGILGETITGNVAETFEVSDGGKVFTFKLREGLKWSDGQPVTTDDVAFAYQDVLLNDKISPSFPSWLKSGNNPKGNPMELEVLDGYSFRITFDQPYGGFLAQLAIVDWRGCTELVKPKHYLTQFHADYTPLEKLEPLIQEAELQAGEWWTLFNVKDITNWERTNASSIDFPAVSPWLLTEQSPAFYNYDRNPYYFKVDEKAQQLPYIDKINDKLVESVESIVMTVIAGEVDFLYEAGAMPSVPVYKDNEEKGGYNTILLRSHTEPATIYINMTYPEETWRQVVRDLRFRQALNYSLNRDEIIDSVWLGMGAEKPTFHPSEYSPEKANQLLDEMGLDQRDADGFRLGPDGQTFIIPFEQSNRTPEMTPTCELVVEFFNAVGLKTSMQTIANSLRAERSAANQLKATIERCGAIWWGRFGGWTIYEWARAWYQWYSSGGEAGEEPPPEVIKFYDLSSSTMIVPPEELKAVSDELDKMLYDNLFYICPVAKERRPIIASKKLGNVAKDGFSIAAAFAGEALFFRD